MFRLSRMALNSSLFNRLKQKTLSVFIAIVRITIYCEEDRVHEQ
jgi:hypothetical protein